MKSLTDLPTFVFMVRKIKMRLKFSFVSFSFPVKVQVLKNAIDMINFTAGTGYATDKLQLCQ